MYGEGRGVSETRRARREEEGKGSRVEGRERERKWVRGLYLV